MMAASERKEPDDFNEEKAGESGRERGRCEALSVA
jgi:hypothetical protein